MAIFLHKFPEGFTVASLMLASGQIEARGVYFVRDSGRGDTAGHGLNVSGARGGGIRAAVFSRRDALCRGLRFDPGSE